MATRIRERDLVIPALKLAAQRPTKEISTADLIGELEAIFEPEGQDAEVLEGRNDTYFSQKVRNLISHRTGPRSMFSKGYADYTGDGIKITEKGLKLLAQLPEE